MRSLHVIPDGTKYRENVSIALYASCSLGQASVTLAELAHLELVGSCQRTDIRCGEDPVTFVADCSTQGHGTLEASDIARANSASDGTHGAS